MNDHPLFAYSPNEFEAEKASNSYLMSVIAVMIGLPLPVINLIATAIFYLANKRATHFVRWHCMQALLSQGCTFPFNAAAVYWTLSIVFGTTIVSNAYVAYIITVIIFNAVEFIATVYAAVQTRKGYHVEWWLFGPLTHSLIKS